MSIRRPNSVIFVHFVRKLNISDFIQVLCFVYNDVVQGSYSVLDAGLVIRFENHGKPIIKDSNSRGFRQCLVL